MPILVIRNGRFRAVIHAANFVRLLVASFEKSTFSMLSDVTMLIVAFL
jgi:hypothetical protein